MVGPSLIIRDIAQRKKCVKSWQPSNNYYVNTHEQGGFYKVYHQNVQGLKGKLNLLSNFLYSELTHIVCLTEHQLKDQEMNLASIEHYKLGAKYCRQQYKNVGTCIFLHESINYDIIPTDHICKEKDLEMCAFKLNHPKTNIVIIVIYRAPSGNYDYFLKKLELFLKASCTITTEYIICGDVNVDYLHSHSRKQQLDMLLATYNLTSIVNFPTRIVNGSSTAIDNFFIDLSRKYTIKPLINGISDHDTQLLVMEKVMLPTQKLTSYFIRDFNDHSIHDFLMHLSMENWEDVLAGNNINIFNKFLDTYLKLFNMCFKKQNTIPTRNTTLG